MGNSTITATYNASNGTWTWSGSDVSSGSNTYDADDSTDFTVNLVTQNVPAGTTIALLPQGVGSGYMAEFEGFTGSPLCMSSFNRVNGNQFTFTDTNPPETDNNTYFLRIGIAVTSGGTTNNQYSPDPIIINKDPDGNRRVTLPEPQLTAAHS